MLFPALTTTLATDPVRAGRLFTVGGRTLLVLLVPLVALPMLFAEEALTIWLGAAFAAESAPVLRWLTIGVFINCLARPVFITLQGYGRPDLGAKANLAELVPYILVLWWIIPWQGIIGAAMAWTARIAIDTIILYIIAMRQIPAMRAAQAKVLLHTAGAVVVLVALTLPQSLWLKGGLALFIVALCGGIALRELRQMLKWKRTGSDGTQTKQ